MKRQCLCGRRWAHALRLAVLGLAMWSTLTTFGQDRPNIILIVTDDQGIEAIQGANWPNDLQCKTPNLAAMAARGRVLVNARSYPVCSPTRASLLTGRSTFRTGVVGVLWEETPLIESNRLALQSHERTIAEILRDRGYYTLLADKWHVGWDKNAGNTAETQGFDDYIDYHDSINRDRSDRVGDEHISYMIDQVVKTIDRHQPQSQPYALFFWTIDPHQRVDDTGREPLKWWRVSDSLLPSGEDYYATDTNRNRYRAVIEAVDTELARMLRELGVIDSGNNYIESSNTVVIFTSDNGSPPSATVTPGRAKSTVYEAGVRVPLFAFGENVPADGEFVTRLTQPEDLFETIADVVGAPPTERGSLPRTGFSFADSIGYSAQPLPERPYFVAAQGHADNAALSRVGFSDGSWKLIVRGGGANLAPLSGDEFYHLLTDPRENVNLVTSGMSDDQRAAYRRMRDAIVNYWPSAVGAKLVNQVDIPLLNVLSIDSSNQRSATIMTVGHLNPGRDGAAESRTYVRFNTDRIDDLLPPGKTVNDVTSAQIILAFRSDTIPGADTAAITLRPMLANWWTGTPSWSSLFNGYNSGISLGIVDIAPNILPNPSGSQQMGVPIPTGTPVSFGHSADLLALMRQWHDDPGSNYGAVLIATPLNELAGDQRATFLPNGVLRLTVNE